MEKDAITVTAQPTPEEMMADLVSKFFWIIFAATTCGLVILIETLILNRGCTL